MSSIETILRTDTLAQLATSRPGASRVFHRHNLDFCCHGGVSLGQACERKGLDVEALIREIEDADRGADPVESWQDRSNGELIGYIVTHFHGPHREELPRLLSMARRVERVHGDKASCPRGLAEHLATLASDLEQHMQKEEQVLFPMLMRGDGALAGAIRVMEQEHADAGAILASIRALTTDYQAPDDACGTWRALYMGLGQFEHDLMQHVHLETYVLFPRAARN